MKKYIPVLIICFFIPTMIHAQGTEIKPVHIHKPVYFAKTPALTEMKEKFPDLEMIGTGEVMEFTDVPYPEDPFENSFTTYGYSVLQDFMGYHKQVDPFVNAEGIWNVQNRIPPDTEGDAGPDHYVQMVNMVLAVFNKQGDMIYGPVSNLTIWQNEPEPWAGSSNGDPIVLYDEQADRWLISELSFPNHPYGPYYEKIAISQTGDPTGAWYLYGYEYEYFCDYPKIGIWHDGYYMTTNNNYWDGQWHFHAVGVSVFERDSMLSGSPDARRIFFDFYPVTEAWSALPAHNDGNPPPDNAPAPLAYYKEAYPDRIMIYNVLTNWNNPQNSSLEHNVTLYPESFSGNMPDGIPQPDGAPYLASLSNRLLYRLQYRNFGSYQSMVTNHTVNTGNGVAGIRWYEFRNSDFGWQIYQQGTYSPDNTCRWMGSIAMDCFGNIALGYSVSGYDTYPSIRFTGRFRDDPKGIMTIGESEIIQGSGVQLSQYHRWGDYSTMSVDPASPTTFWYTQEYYETTGDRSWQTRIAAFTIYDSLSVSVTAGSDNLCAGDSTQLFAQTEGGNNSFSYSWYSHPQGFFSDEQNPHVMPDTTTWFFCDVSDGMTSDSDSIRVTVFPLPSAFAGMDTIICAGQNYHVLDAEASNYSALLWSTSGDGSFDDDTVLHTTYTPGGLDKLTGEVTLTLTAFPYFQCDTATDHIVLNIDPCTGVSGIDDPAVLIKPNPSGGMFELVMKGFPQETTYLVLRSLSGTIINRKIIQPGNSGDRLILNETYSSGIYLLEVTTESISIAKKVVIY